MHNGSHVTTHQTMLETTRSLSLKANGSLLITAVHRLQSLKPSENLNPHENLNEPITSKRSIVTTPIHLLLYPNSPKYIIALLTLFTLLFNVLFI